MCRVFIGIGAEMNKDNQHIEMFYTDMFSHLNLRGLLYHWALDVYEAELKYDGMFLPVEKKDRRCLVK